MSKAPVHEQWQNRWIFILAATGSAVGLGNIWKFPYITGENGGGAFVVVYLLCVAALGIPIMLAEVLLGARGRLSPVNSMRSAVAESNTSKGWVVIGWMGVLAGLMVLCFYSVIAGWALDYVALTAIGTFNGANATDAKNIFDNMLASPGTLIFWHTVFMLMTMGVLLAGVTKGLGMVARVLMPILFVVMLIMLGYAMVTGEFMKAVSFMFSFNFDALTSKSILIALGHAFFTLSLGMGAIMAYGAYMHKDGKLGQTVLTIGFLDTLIALVAGLCIFPIVFAQGASPSSGPGLLFQSLPIAFGAMPGGLIFGTLFFILVVIAAWSSAVSLIEPGVAWLIETKKFTRKQACLVLGMAVWAVGVLCALSFNVLDGFTPIWLFGKNVFDFLDFATSQLMLPIGGLLMSIFVGWKLARPALAHEVGNLHTPAMKMWLFALRYVSPVMVSIVLVVGLYNALFT